MKITSFSPTKDLIYLRGLIWSPQRRKAHQVRLALDTAAAETVIVPSLLDEIGYTPSMGDAITSMRSAVGQEPGYMMKVARFACLGFHIDDYRVHVHELPIGWELQGLLGLTFLRRLNYLIRSEDGTIAAEQVANNRLSIVSSPGASRA